MGVVLIVGLILVIFDLDEVGVFGSGVEGEGDKCVDGGGFGDDFEGPGLIFLVSVLVSMVGRAVGGGNKG